MTTIKCPHCKSVETESLSAHGGITIDVLPPVYYSLWRCNACHEHFAVKHDDQNPVLAIIKDFHIGGFYDDGIGLDE